MLLQISEPEAEMSDDTRVWGVGIDLGTTHSVVAYAQKGVSTILNQASGKGLLPSIVAYDPGGQVQVGEQARNRLQIHPEQVVCSIKRLMGRALGDDALMHFPHPVRETEDGLGLELGQRLLTPTEISADILREIFCAIEAQLGYPVSKAVITVPAYFDEGAREATRNAAELAGFDVLRLLNEPTAAALAYDLDTHPEGLYGVYDLGGGTFDFSLLKMEKGIFRVLATGGDLALGGDDIDQAIAVHALKNRFHKLSFGQQKQILEKAKQTKETLGLKPRAVLELGEAFGDGAPQQVSFSQNTLNLLAEPFVNRTLFLVQQVLKDAGVDQAELSGVICVGGSTRLAYVQQALTDFFQRPPLTSLDPDYAVAMGAAKQAEALTRGASHLLLDITPLSLGIETMGGLVERLIPRNAPIPTQVSQTFTTFQEHQRAMKIHVVQGERELVKDCRSLAHFELQGIPPMSAGMARIHVTFSLDADGLLTVKAQEKTTQIFQEIEVKPSYGLGADKMRQLLEESRRFASEDLLKRLWEQKKLEALQSLREVEKLLKKRPAFLSPADINILTRACQELRQAIKEEQLQQLSEQLKAFTNCCLPFIEKALQEAIQGGRPPL
ncbi:MAG: Fe-S protein assembly chaperone HscA [Alphaproteobacteria bacterium]